MPTYEYVCTACDNHWEEVQKISADALEVCPKCEQSTAKRQISGGNFILKGGGWYADAYSSQPKPKPWALGWRGYRLNKNYDQWAGHQGGLWWAHLMGRAQHGGHLIH